MKKLLLIMSLALILCGVSYAENDDTNIETASNEETQIASNEDTQTTSNEDTQTTSNEETQTASNEDTQTTSNEETQTTSNEDTQTTSNEETQTTSNEETQTTSNEETQTTSNEEAQTTSNEETQTTSNEEAQTTSNEEATSNEEVQTNLIMKIKEDIHNKLYSKEFQDAYDFAFNNKITTMDSINAADLEGGLTRIAMAKMLSNYATNILGKEPADIVVPHFSDVSQKLNEEYGNAVDLAYQLGIMGIGIDEFRPYDPVTRAEFATALSRMLYGLADGLDVYYTTHMEKLKEEGIISNTNPDLEELRGYVMIMLMRSAKTKLGVIKDFVENKLEEYQDLTQNG